LNIQCVSNDITDENKGMTMRTKFYYFFESIENWNRTCDRLIELIEANELAQMNTMDLQTYSKLILELDSSLTSYKRTITKYKHFFLILEPFCLVL
jgi:hypothetical protein